MKKLIIYNVVLFISGISFFMLNSSLSAYMYFNPAQSFFTRSDYMVHFLSSGAIFGLMIIILLLLHKNTEDNMISRIMSNERIIVGMIGCILSIIFAIVVLLHYDVTDPFQELYNPYIYMVGFYFFEVGLLGLFIYKHFITLNK
jgi:hypothetical protein